MNTIETLYERDEIFKNIDNLKAFVESTNFADINKKYGGWNQTLLHIAARKNLLDCVKYLIENGADINALDRYSDTPLHDVAYMGHNSIIEYLLERGADKEHINHDGKTASQKAHYQFIAVYIDAYESIPTKGVQQE